MKLLARVETGQASPSRYEDRGIAPVRVPFSLPVTLPRSGVHVDGGGPARCVGWLQRRCWRRAHRTKMQRRCSDEGRTRVESKQPYTGSSESSRASSPSDGFSVRLRETDPRKRLAKDAR